MKKTIEAASATLMAAVTWRERHDKALAEFDAATERYSAAREAGRGVVEAEACMKRAQAAYELVMDEAEVGTGQASVH